MLVGGMIGNKIKQDLQAQLMRMYHEPVEVVERPKYRRDGARVGDVVAEVGHRRRIDWRYPHGVHTKHSQVFQSRRDARKIADSVAVFVLKGSRINLIDHASLPPRQV